MYVIMFLLSVLLFYVCFIFIGHTEIKNVRFYNQVIIILSGMLAFVNTFALAIYGFLELFKYLG